MPNVTLNRSLSATPSQVWAVLADFPNIADWNEGVKASHSTSDAVEGVGATRHCDLAPLGALEETVREWVPEQRLVVSIDKASGLPIKHGDVTFTLGSGDAETPFNLSYDFVANGGPIAPIMGALLKRQLTKGFTGFIDQLEVAAQQRSATG